MSDSRKLERELSEAERNLAVSIYKVRALKAQLNPDLGIDPDVVPGEIKLDKMTTFFYEEIVHEKENGGRPSFSELLSGAAFLAPNRRR